MIVGGPGNDTIYGGGGDDLICGGRGNDTIDGGIGNDTIYGDGATTFGDPRTSPGRERHDRGGGDDDQIFGEAGNDTIDGDSGNDTIGGKAGTDTVSGGSGDDTVFGGSGKDTVDGGSGRRHRLRQVRQRHAERRSRQRLPERRLPGPVNRARPGRRPDAGQHRHLQRRQPTSTRAFGCEIAYRGRDRARGAVAASSTAEPASLAGRRLRTPSVRPRTRASKRGRAPSAVRRPPGFGGGPRGRSVGRVSDVRLPTRAETASLELSRSGGGRCARSWRACSRRAARARRRSTPGASVSYVAAGVFFTELALSWVVGIAWLMAWVRGVPLAGACG